MRNARIIALLSPPPNGRDSPHLVSFPPELNSQTLLIFAFHPVEPTASLDRPKTEMSRAEAAALLEKKHLKECEENDYMILEGLIESRGSIDASAQGFEV